MYRFFSKLGYQKRQLEWFPILVVRLCLGVFFTKSGFFKVFEAKQHENLLKTLQSAHFSWPEFHAYLLPLTQLICGILILVGLITSLASLILFVIMILALITDRIANVATQGGLIYIENLLYLPELLYTLLFLWLFFSGPGKASLDHKYGKKKRLHNNQNLSL